MLNIIVDVVINMDIGSFYSLLWNNYIEVTPQAKAIHNLFTSYGESVVNDHVAFRTFSNSPIAIDKLEAVLFSLGYQRFDNYVFEAKKLVACSYNHKEKTAPKVFLSELQRQQLSAQAQGILDEIVFQIPVDCVQDPSIFWKGLLWRMPTAFVYHKLLKESEYAAWLVTMGLRVNHFTISLNHLKQIANLQSVIDLLKQNNFSVNAIGGEIKGSPNTLLEQAATLADNISVEFSDGKCQRVPSCFYEFAKRYPTKDGELFQGFVTNNADKIFESTNSG